MGKRERLVYPEPYNLSLKKIFQKRLDKAFKPLTEEEVDKRLEYLYN